MEIYCCGCSKEVEARLTLLLPLGIIVYVIIIIAVFIYDIKRKPGRDGYPPNGED